MIKMILKRYSEVNASYGIEEGATTRKVYLFATLAVFTPIIFSTVPKVLADTLQSNLPLKVKDKVLPKAYAFSLFDVRLLESPFKTAMELDAKYLLSLESDRFLSRYRKFAGLEPKAEAYGGWERATISGHSLGHYLTAVSKLYASSDDQRLLDRVNYIVDEPAECQKAWGNGFVGGFLRSQEVFAEVKAGDIRRDARAGGWFCFEMKVVSDAPIELSCLYWGSEGPGRDFDILVDEQSVSCAKTVTIGNRWPIMNHIPWKRTSTTG